MPRFPFLIFATVAFLCAAVASGAAEFAAPVNPVASGGASGSAAGNLDADAKMEFVTAGSSSSSSNHFRIYKHSSGGSFQLINIAVSSPGISSRRNRWGGDLEIADLNGDGWNDIIVPDSWNQSTDGGGGAAGRSGRLTWFENPEGDLDAAWTEHELSTWSGSDDYSGSAPNGNSVEHMSELAAGDIDGNGRTDVVIRDIRSGFWIFLQQDSGAEGSNWHPRIFIPVRPREGLGLADLDGDGDLDIILNGIWFETPEDAVNGTYTQHTFAPTFTQGSQSVNFYPASYNHATAASSNTVMRNYASKVAAADFNGDGRPDIAISNSEELATHTAAKPYGIYIYLAPTDPVNETWTQVELHDSHYSWHTLQVADLDRDGDVDVVSAISNVGTDDTAGQIYAWMNDGSGAFSRETISAAAANNYTYQGILGDADGDGDPDLLAPYAFNTGVVRYFQNTTLAPVVPDINITPAPASIGENAGPLVLTLSLSAATTVDISVNYTALAGSATPELDFGLTENLQVTIPAGAESGTVEIPILRDVRFEEDETFTVAFTLADPARANLLQESVEVTIVDEQTSAFSTFTSLHSLTGGRTGDDDFGGSDNETEFWLSTNPTDPADDLRLRVAAVNPPLYTLEISELKPVANYRLHFKSSLEGAPLGSESNLEHVFYQSFIGGMNPGDRLNFQWQDSSVTENGFYRLTIEPVLLE